MRHRTFFIASSLDAAAVPRHFHALGVALLSRGHQVVFLRQPGPEIMPELDSRIEVRSWPSARPTRFADVLFFLRLLRLRRPDCLLANFGAVNIMCAVGALLGVRHRIAYYHTLASQIDVDSELPRWRLDFLRARKRWFYRFVSHCISNSAAASQELQVRFGLPSSKCLTWQISLEDPLSRLPAGFGTRSPVPSLVCVGRLQRSKGQDVLIRSLPELAARVPSLRVLFVGEGKLREEYEALARGLGVGSLCTFTGRISHERSMEAIASAWVTVVPSRAEALGLVNIESMALSRPVVASNVGGIPDVIRDGIEGILIPPDAPEVLSDRVSELLLDPGRGDELGRNGRIRFLDRFERSKLVCEQADWLEALP